MKKKNVDTKGGRSERKSKSPTTTKGEDPTEENDVANAKRIQMTREESGVKRKRGSNGVREIENTEDTKGVKKSKAAEMESPLAAKKTKSTALGGKATPDTADRAKEKSMNSKRGK